MNILNQAIDVLEESNQGDSKQEITEDTQTIGRETDHQNSEKVRQIITDNSAGILPEIQTRLFDPFFTTKNLGKGTGLR